MEEFKGMNMTILVVSNYSLVRKKIQQLQLKKRRESEGEKNKKKEKKKEAEKIKIHELYLLQNPENLMPGSIKLMRANSSYAFLCIHAMSQKTQHNNF